MNMLQKGRGAQINTANRFSKQQYNYDELNEQDAWEKENSKTNYLEIYPKSILNKVDSDDVPLLYSVNPYQGCEHGCIYCYARNSHEYWGYSAGIEFEQKILYKKNASALLAKKFRSSHWIPQPISLSGNTDCYQPIEKKLKITRSLLEQCLAFNNPVGIITKNKLILRDLDILIALQKKNLVQVFISITSTNEKLRQKLEARTSSYKSRFEIIEQLSKHNIPVGVMNAPIIPGLNEIDMYEVLRQSSLRGAKWAGYTIVRLNRALQSIFSDWMYKAYPDKAEKVLNSIRNCHDGKLNDSRNKIRMRGTGVIADAIANQFQLYCNKFNLNKTKFEYDCSHFSRNGQLSLF